MTSYRKSLAMLLVSCALGFAQTWTAPQKGWLYVLDVGGVSGQVLLVDPASGTVKGTIQTNYHPNFGLCPDGSRLYISDGSQSSGFLSIFDVQTGQLLKRVPLDDRALYTVRPSFSGIGCSADGKRLFVQIMRTVSPGVDQYTLSVIDSSTGTLIDSVALPVRGIAQIVSWPFGGWDTAVECSNTNSVRFISLDADGHVQRTQDVALTWAPKTAPDGSPVNKGQSITTSVVTDQKNRTMALFRAAGGIDQISADTMTVQAMVADSWQHFVLPGSAVLSPSGTDTYVGFKAYDQRTEPGGFRNSISVLRSADGVQTTSMDTTLPFASLAISGDGLVLYTANTAARSITVIDAISMQELKTIPDIGKVPALILVQP
jgi:DNA-binding beta-propeller fold protein YncE